MQLLFTIFFLVSINHNGKATKDSIFLNTNSHFEIVRHELNFIGDSINKEIEFGKDVVWMEMDSSISFKVKQLSYKDCMLLFKNPKTDWATNILLYAVYQRDATPLITLQGRKDWTYSFKKAGKSTSMKNQDIIYWRKHLFFR